MDFRAVGKEGREGDPPLFQTHQIKLFNSQIKHVESDFKFAEANPYHHHACFFEDLLCAKHSTDAPQAFFPGPPRVQEREVPTSSLTNGAQRGHWPAQGHTARKQQQQASPRAPSHGLSIFFIHTSGIICSSVLRDVLRHGRSHASGILSGGIVMNALAAMP